MPYSHDQPDNARRMRRLGITRVLARNDYSAQSAHRHIAALLNDRRYAQRAVNAASTVVAENGTTAPCDALSAVSR